MRKFSVCRENICFSSIKRSATMIFQLNNETDYFTIICM